MTKKKYNEEDGVWRTIGGRKVFIRKGQSLSDAMKESGKFKKASDVKRGEYQQKNLENERLIAHDNDTLKHNEKSWLNYNKKAGELSDREMAEVYAKTYPKGRTDIQDLKGKHINNDNKYKGLTEEGKRIASGNFKNQEEKDMWEKAGRDTQELLKGEKEKYKSTKHEGFGDYNDDYIPVYNNNIDYTGDFSRANLSKLSNEELTSALNKQSELYDEAVNERLGDQRTRNGKMDKIFNTAKKQKYESGMSAINNEMKNRNMPRYNIYGDNGEVRVSSPTKEMAEKQLANMRETDKQLQKEYGWDKLPDYTMVEESKTGFDSEDKKGAFDFTQDEVDRAYSTMREKMQHHMDNDDRKWSAREYTNAEFLAHMEDANWHSELHQLEDANLTEKELTYIKNKTSLSSYGVGNELTGKANVQKMIDEAKNNSSIQKQNKAMLGNKYKGKGLTPNLVYSSGRRIDIDNEGNAIVWKDGKIERKTKLPDNVTGDKVKDYFDTYLPQLDNSAIESAYQQYLREHKYSKMSLATFKRNYKK